MPRNYHMILTASRVEPDDDGIAIELPVGTIINTIVWDGETPFDVPADIELVAVEG